MLSAEVLLLIWLEHVSDSFLDIWESSTGMQEYTLSLSQPRRGDFQSLSK